MTRAGLGAASLTGVPLLAGCGADASPRTTKVQYQQFGSGTVMRDFLHTIGDQLGAEHPLKLVPLVASEDDYFTKNELMMSSPNTTPDLVYEDTFILKSDVGAGYLQPIDDLIKDWPRWQDFTEQSRQAVTADDGRIYAVPTHTDTRALWCHGPSLEAAGLPASWQPKTWDELLDGLRRIKSRTPEVIPFNIFSGKPQGEKASMQGFEMLLYGTGSTLYEESSGKWVVGSQGFLDALRFLDAVFSEKLTPSVSDALNPNLTETIYNDWTPRGRLAINLDGSWISQNWVEGAPGAWPRWSKDMQLATMPTQHGQGRGWVTLAGGWCWAIPKRSDKRRLSWRVLRQIMQTRNMVDLAVADNQVTIRDDIAASATYRGYSPTIEFFTELGKHAVYRPALPAYPQVSSEIQQAMGVVMTGKSRPEQAAADYDRAVTELVGARRTTKG
ncbi:extracellular solute-binding protein [Microlunatus soli]|uniref:Multiple sugar transport system substrate-binding protein n=1 Tax=Microlunatus soli TaxID=630515 RepID=A0A1H1N6F0_9ACTN|nr:extracellular solute-binding protein [Microlunatus soli]SDR93729.1 multiple sugar transport system substrate-binding protein [Microlunatus soli]